MTSIRVDGNDAFAVHNAVREARALALAQNVPVLVEAMTYRVGHHSTSDDSTVYRTQAEVDLYRTHDNPIDRLHKYMRAKGWWSDAEEKALYADVRAEVLAELRKAEKVLRPPPSELFSDVYHELTPRLRRQKEQLDKVIAAYPQDYDMTLYEKQ